MSWLCVTISRFLYDSGSKKYLLVYWLTHITPARLKLPRIRVDFLWFWRSTICFSCPYIFPYTDTPVTHIFQHLLNRQNFTQCPTFFRNLPLFVSFWSQLHVSVCLFIWVSSLKKIKTWNPLHTPKGYLKTFFRQVTLWAASLEKLHTSSTLLFFKLSPKGNKKWLINQTKIKT